MERCGILTQRLRQPHDDVEAAVAFEQLAGDFATDGGRDGVLHVAGVQAVADQRLAVRRDGQQRQARGLLQPHVGRAVHRLRHRLHLFAEPHQRIQVVAVNLDRHVRAHAGDQLIHAHLDRLGELVVVARYLLHRGFDLGHQRRLCLARVGPFAARLEHDEGIGDRGWHRIGRHLGGPELAEHAIDLGELLDPRLQRGLHMHGLVQAGAGNAHRMHGDVAFVQAGHELRAQARAQQAAQHHRRQRAGHHGPAPAQCPCQCGRVGATRPLHQPRVLLLHLAAQEQRDGGRHERQRQHHRAGQGQHHRDRHRVEHLSLHAGEREDRQVDRGDDAQAEQAGPDDLGGRGRRRVQAFFLGQRAAQRVLQFAETAQAVLDDDDRAVHDQAEIQRTQAHQVAGHAATDHAGQREQHRQRDHRRGDERRTHVAQQQEQHGDDQQRALHQVLRHRADGAVDQRGAVVHRYCAHTRRQAAIRLDQACRGGLRDLATVGPDQHEGGTQHDFPAVHRRRTGPQLRAFAHLGHIAHADRHALAPVQHDVADALQVGDLPRCAHEELLAIALDVTRADVLVVGGDRRDHVVQGEAQRDQSCRVRRDVDLAREAADGVDLGHARHVAQLRTHDPVLQRAQVGGGERCAVRLARLRVGFHRVHEDLAHAGGDGAHLRFQSRGQLRLDLLQALGHLLAREVQVGAVLEHHGHLRQPVARDRARVVQSRQSRQGRLDRERHPLFGLQWRVPVHLRVDLHLHVGDVGRDVDGQPAEAPAADGDQRDRQRQHQPAMGDGEAQDAFEQALRRRDRGISGHARPPTSRCRPSPGSSAPPRLDRLP